jgi:N-acetylglucosamine-6-phosphate deacetylase
MAITDGTAGAGLPVGTRTRLGGRPIVVTQHAAALDDGTMAGSVATMDTVFRMLVDRAQLPVVAIARMMATTPAAQLGLGHVGAILEGQRADLVVLDEGLRVVQTYIGGLPALEP